MSESETSKPTSVIKLLRRENEMLEAERAAARELRRENLARLDMLHTECRVTVSIVRGIRTERRGHVPIGGAVNFAPRSL